MNLADIIILVFFLVAMIAGYLGGGFKEILNLACLFVTMVVFSFDSVKAPIVAFAGKNLSYLALVIVFLATYFILKKLLAWVMKSLISEREGVLGGMNKFLGVIAGSLKASLVLIFFVYLLKYLWAMNVLIEAKTFFTDSIMFAVGSKVVELLT